MFFNYSICLYYSFFIFSRCFFFFSAGIFLLFINKVFFIEYILNSPLKLDLVFPIIIDSYGLLFSSLVLYISGNIFSFSSYYMEAEIFISRFINIVVLFVMSINFLIYIPHLIGLLLGWDGLGIVSFLLVIYYQNSKSLSAGILTALSNRVGDVIILLRIGWCINQGYWCIIYADPSSPYSGLIIFSVTLAAITKRAQVPFSSWLPAAIAAPTPVRALVHSSTLVTAGVFLMVRFYPFLRRHIIFNTRILIISCMTMFMSGLSAIFECDIKKVVALSTLSQLGVIISAIGLGFPSLAFFHLLRHALFKALLFVCVGTFINRHAHNQDIRRIGNLCFQSPLTSCCLSIARMALCGLPFLSGFYSKDLLIELSLFNNYSFVILWLFILSTALTSCYRIRLYITGISSIHIGFSFHLNNDNNIYNTSPIIILCLGAIFGGCIINWILIYPFEDPCIPVYFKLLALIVTLLGGYLSFYITTLHSCFSVYLPFLFHINSFIWFMVPLSTQAYLRYSMFLGKCNLVLTDQGWIEVIGPKGVFLTIKKSFKKYESLYNIIYSSFTYFIILTGTSAIFFIYCFLYIIT